MKKIMIVLFTLVAVGGLQALYAQEADQNIGETPDKKEFTEPVRNVVYLELGGPGLLYSINYERKFTDRLWVRAGAGYFFIMGSANIGIQYLFGDGPWHFESGIGVSGAFMEDILTGFTINFGQNEDNNEENGSDREYMAYYNTTIGLRYQKKEQNIFFKVGFTPLVTINLRRAVPFGGLSFGVTF
jgi:hypothetical protein